MSKSTQSWLQSEKAWGIAALVYIILPCVVSDLFGYDCKLYGPMSPWQAIFFAPLVWGLALFFIQFGSSETVFGSYKRDESPIGFWISISIISAVGFAFFFWGVYKLVI